MRLLPVWSATFFAIFFNLIEYSGPSQFNQAFSGSDNGGDNDLRRMFPGLFPPQNLSVKGNDKIRGNFISDDQIQQLLRTMQQKALNDIKSAASVTSQTKHKFSKPKITATRRPHPSEHADLNELVELITKRIPDKRPIGWTAVPPKKKVTSSTTSPPILLENLEIFRIPSEVLLQQLASATTKTTTVSTTTTRKPKTYLTFDTILFPEDIPTPPSPSPIPQYAILKVKSNPPPIPKPRKPDPEVEIIAAVNEREEEYIYQDVPPPSRRPPTPTPEVLAKLPGRTTPAVPEYELKNGNKSVVIIKSVELEPPPSLTTTTPTSVYYNPHLGFHYPNGTKATLEEALGLAGGKEKNQKAPGQAAGGWGWRPDEPQPPPPYMRAPPLKDGAPSIPDYMPIPVEFQPPRQMGGPPPPDWNPSSRPSANSRYFSVNKQGWGSASPPSGMIQAATQPEAVWTTYPAPQTPPPHQDASNNHGGMQPSNALPTQSSGGPRGPQNRPPEHPPPAPSPQQPPNGWNNPPPPPPAPTPQPQNGWNNPPNPPPPPSPQGWNQPNNPPASFRPQNNWNQANNPPPLHPQGPPQSWSNQQRPFIPPPQPPWGLHVSPTNNAPPQYERPNEPQGYNHQPPQGYNNPPQQGYNNQPPQGYNQPPQQQQYGPPEMNGPGPGFTLQWGPGNQPSPMPQHNMPENEEDHFADPYFQVMNMNDWEGEETRTSGESQYYGGWSPGKPPSYPSQYPSPPPKGGKGKGDKGKLWKSKKSKGKKSQPTGWGGGGYEQSDGWNYNNAWEEGESWGWGDDDDDDDSKKGKKKEKKKKFFEKLKDSFKKGKDNMDKAKEKQKAKFEEMKESWQATGSEYAEHYKEKASDWWEKTKDKVKEHFEEKKAAKGWGWKSKPSFYSITQKIYGITISVLALVAFFSYIVALLFQTAVTTLSAPLLEGIIGLAMGDGGAALFQALLGFQPGGRSLSDSCAAKEAMLDELECKVAVAFTAVRKYSSYLG